MTRQGNPITFTEHRGDTLMIGMYVRQCQHGQTAVTELPHTPTGRIAKHQLSRERNDHEVDFDAARAGGR
jgi:hypothetical protein